MKRKILLISIIASFFLTNSCTDEESTSPTDNNNDDSNEVPDPVANFSINGGNDFAPSKVELTNQSNNATSYSWDFGDGNSSSSTNPIHIYNEGGTYNITLTAENSEGITDVINKSVNIKDKPTKLKVNKIEITNFSWIDPETSSGWDSNSGPDLIVYIRDENNQILFDSGDPISNVTISDLPITITKNLPVELVDFLQTKYVYLYDSDFWSDDDYIGGYQFEIDSWVPYGGDGYPSLLKLSHPDFELDISFYVDWL